MPRWADRYSWQGNGLSLDPLGNELEFLRCFHFAPERAADSDVAFHSNDATHQLGQSLCHHQADARARDATSFLAESIEGLKELRQLFRRQSLAGIPYAQANAIIGVHCAVYHHRSLLSVVFDRVGKQVDHDLLQAGHIGFDIERGAELRKYHLDSALLRLRLHHGLAFRHEIGQ